MIVLLHVSVAVASVLYTGYLYLRPSKAKLRVSYALVAATFVSGTYLVVAKPAHLVTACMMGLGYLAVTLFGIVAARQKLARVVEYEDT